MSRSSISFAALLTSAGAALAADVPATSKIDAVTVFPQGAEIMRVAKVRIERGEHVVILTDLPGQIQAGSIRVEGKATGRLDIGSVDNRVIPVASTDAAQAETERRRLDKEIEQLRDERSVLEALIQAAETQKELVKRMTELPTHPAPSSPGITSQATDWSQIFTLIGNRMTEAQKTILGAQVTIRELDRKLVDLEKKRQTTAPRIENRTEVKVAVTAADALDGELTVRYMVPSASWSPNYDARLAVGAKATAPKLTLTRRAAISQRTGEAWDNVLLTLSTARPAAGTAAPELRPWTLDFVENMPRPVPVASMPASPVARGMVEDASKLDDGRMRQKLAAGVMDQMREEAATQRTATVELGSFQATFAIKDRVTVLPTGETKRVLADEISVEPALTVRAVPRVDPKGYLYAKITLPKTAPYLPGPVSLFRDQTFVGTGRLPQLTPGEEHELGFGADDLVRVRYNVADEKRGETGLISTSKTDNRNFRITIKNGHERPIATTVIDQLPVANNQEIKVEATGRAPTRKDLDDKRGVIAWDDTLKPDEEKVIDFGYRIAWPAAKTLSQGR